jgi:hypothetical protein
MRHEVLFAVPLTLTLLAVVPVGAQSVAYRTASPSAQLLAPLIADSLSARMRALGLLRSPSPVAERVAFADTTHGGPECPMPILHPDSSKQFAAIKTEPLRSSDRMPTRVSSCVNPLEKSQQSP